MDDAIKDWAMKDTPNQTLDNAILHFTKAHEFQRETKVYLKETMTAHQVVKHHAIKTEKPASQNQEPDTSLEGFYYCWTHEVCTHRGAQCLRPAPGHIPTVTLKNTQGGAYRLYRLRGARGNNGCKEPGGRTQNHATKRKMEETQPST
jgi:hypothetical protein